MLYLRVCNSYLLEPSPLLLLLLDTFLAVMEELALVLLGVTALRCQLGLLPLQRLRALLILLLQPQEVPPQSRLARHVQDGAAGKARERERWNKEKTVCAERNWIDMVQYC